MIVHLLIKNREITDQARNNRLLTHPTLLLNQRRPSEIIHSVALNLQFFK